LRLSAASLLSILLVAVWIAACQTSALGRSQFKLFPESAMSEMGVTAFAEISQRTPVSSSASANRVVSCVAGAVTGAIDSRYPRISWEVRVFEDDTPNAFALPGGKIGVNTGLFKVARNQHQLATVIGHEVAHVLEGHSNERVSAEVATQTALQTLEAAIVDPTNPMHGEMFGLLGLGTQIGVLMPYGRQHESEADLLGLDMMARAGFDPRESVALWQNMAAAGGAQPPEFMSTHPSYGTRIAGLQRRMGPALQLYADAATKGRSPVCQ
jgi:predicted Zn-dependent protease